MPNHGEKKASPARGLAPHFHFASTCVRRPCVDETRYEMEREGERERERERERGENKKRIEEAMSCRKEPRQIKTTMVGERGREINR